jgi:hypothetical protein
MCPFPTIVAKNQFGEEQILTVEGGTQKIDINFIVDQANGNGLGTRTLKQGANNYISNVFMHTSATPATGNPNPAVGFAIIKFSEAFQGYVTGFDGAVSQLSGSNVNISSGLTQYQPYVVVSVGTSTLANWTAVGWTGPSLPTVGASFVASTASAGTGTGVVQTASVSGITTVEVVGDPNQTINPTTGGGYMIVQFLGATSSSTTTLIPTAPVNNSVWGFEFALLNPIAAPAI